eukprot:CAMPEP_0113706262 /NCGR_PEP_ID=MMETSP0038_2-20120614/27619_1 /TAXON_ID=2898 /ORGANISM="Cryptomonas paramecium" /LENGTH=307 /DNA_ID=CAMNT_0000631419 /DNA_START=114 /DNA_END=1037 /DNA_ORIENTATION=- /assembly_acc=CAM_ASM_000170
MNDLSTAVPSDALRKARRSASRKKALTACFRCKSKRLRCSGYRPCIRCANAGLGDECLFPDCADSSKPVQANDVRSAPSQPDVHDLSASEIPLETADSFLQYTTCKGSNWSGTPRLSSLCVDPSGFTSSDQASPFFGHQSNFNWPRNASNPNIHQSMADAPHFSNLPSTHRARLQDQPEHSAVQQIHSSAARFYSRDVSTALRSPITQSPFAALGWEGSATRSNDVHAFWPQDHLYSLDPTCQPSGAPFLDPSIPPSTRLLDRRPSSSASLLLVSTPPGSATNLAIVHGPGHQTPPTLRMGQDQRRP